MNLEGISKLDRDSRILNKLDRDSRILYDVTDMCNLKNNKLANIFKRRRQQTHRENKLVAPSREQGWSKGRHTPPGKVSSRMCCTAQGT